jgi:hypothetical protein
MPKTMPKHGILGFLIILLAQLFVLLRVPYSLDFYFPVMWFGYILLVDGLVNLFKGRSIFENKAEFLRLFIISAIFWLFFEFVTIVIYQFDYILTHDFSQTKYFILSTITFSTVLPAVVETTDLLNALGIFRRYRPKMSLKLKRSFLYFLIALGVLLFLVPIFYPPLLFPLFWIVFFLILDPINYINNQPSVLRNFAERDFEIPLSLIFSGIICGAFWEFWNYWSYVKGSFMVPFFDFFRLFEIKLFGYVGLLFFTLELFSMYHFLKYVFKQAEVYLKFSLKKETKKPKIEPKKSSKPKKKKK